MFDSCEGGRRIFSLDAGSCALLWCVAEKLGDQEFLELTDGAIVAGVLNVYRERVPGFAWDSIAVAVNQEYARAEVVLKDGDEVALLPPVSGGVDQAVT